MIEFLSDEKFAEWINSLKGLSYEDLMARKDGPMMLTFAQASEYLRVLRQAPHKEAEE